MSLMTTCPHCGTVFSIVLEQLEASDGHVRCGHCMEVFDARSQLTSPLDTVELTTSELEVESISHTDLSFVQQAQKQAFWSKTSVRIGMRAGCLLLLLCLALQILHREHERITEWRPNLLPVTQKICSFWPCPSPIHRQIDAWVIENSSFEKTPLAGGVIAFHLIAQLKNTAKDKLLLPQIELSLVDNNDSMLARKVVDLAAPARTLVVDGEDERSFQFLVTPRSQTGITPSSINGYRLVLFYP